MGRKRNGNGSSGVASGNNQRGMTLREQMNGRNQFKRGGGGGGGGGSGGGGGVGGEPKKVKSVLKLQHLQNLAIWAGGEASIPSLSALFGNRLAACGEEMGGPLDSSLFHCQRCESILQPGYNCTVRIEKNRAKVKRRRKKTGSLPLNYVVSTCHFCSHKNLRRGTPKDHMKEICPSKPKPVVELKLSCCDHKSSSSEKAIVNSSAIGQRVEEMTSSELIPVLESIPSNPEINPASAKEVPDENSPATPMEKPKMLLLDRKPRKRSKSGCNKQVGSESNSASMDTEQSNVGSSKRKRKRKSWSSLKEMVEKTERKNSQDFSDLTIPFIL